MKLFKSTKQLEKEFLERLEKAQEALMPVPVTVIEQEKEELSTMTFNDAINDNKFVEQEEKSPDKATILKIEETIENLFPTEANAKTQLEIKKFSLSYKKMNEEIFKLRRKDGEPIAIPFSFYHNLTCLGGWTAAGEHGNETLVDNKIKRWHVYYLRNFYKDLKIKSDNAIAYEFKGIIPQEVKNNIEKYEEDFGKGRVFMLADCSLCEKSIVEAPKVDPLIIGYHKDSKTFWLLEAFDTTHIENWIASEFQE